MEKVTPSYLRMKYDDMFSKDIVFNSPPIEYESVQYDADINSKTLDAIEVDNEQNDQSLEETPVNGWQCLSNIIFSKNQHKVNFLKNWRQVYEITTKKSE